MARSKSFCSIAVSASAGDSADSNPDILRPSSAQPQRFYHVRLIVGYEDSRLSGNFSHT